MARPKKLSDAEIDKRLADVPGWEVQEGKLCREFRFPTFVEAFSFMSAMALVSEKLDHHPEWCNVYNRVMVELSTHDAGGITTRDFEWARQANSLVGSANA
ncbi:MAG: 4a-hydroxytetrahydrobiopterin dehydratase [Acidobacteria bacterium]|nr:MAG: 4a-hydroxytetrahydrobiopterin dehydratase [Acidobacteriota bacterium]